MIKMSRLKGSLCNDKGTWVIRFRYPGIDGKTKNKAISTKIKVERGNKRKAEEAGKKILAKWEQKLQLTEKGNTYFLPYFEKILQSKKATGRSSTTIDNYYNTYNTHIKKYFEPLRLKLTDIKPEHLNNYIADKKHEISDNTILKHIALIRMVLEDARRNGYITINIVDQIEKPKKTKYKAQHMTADELKSYIEHSKGTKMELPVFFASVFGLRRGEVCGMRWSSIDFENMVIYINCTIRRKQTEDGHWIEIEDTTLKTEASESFYPLNDTVVKYLNDVKDKQDKIKITDWVCIDENGERLQLDYVSKGHNKLIKKYNLKAIRFHDLRHSCLSLLVSQNYNIKTIQAYARHANYTTTADVYAHVEDVAKRAELDSLTAVLLPADSGQKEDSDP